MQITVLSVNVEERKGAGGKTYKMADIAYKDESGKVNGKKIMSFVNPVVFNSLSEASNGSVFNIKMEKNEKTGYWDWIGVEKGNGASTVKANPSPKSTYETPEERAKRQIYIVRQSSLTNAIALSAANGGKKQTPAEIIEVAKQFEDFVFGVVNEKEEAPEQMDMFNDEISF